MLGVIGGSGIYDLDRVENPREMHVRTPYGDPSGPVLMGTMGPTEVAFLPRHGRAHQFSPSDLPYQANIYALKSLGVTHVLSVSAVGSLRETLPPRTRVLPDQIIDRTVARPRSFFGEGVVAHVGIADPFCHLFRQHVATAAATVNAPVELDGTYVCIEGPQFSTRAESQLYRSWDGAVIGMTAMPEARLAREAECCFAMLALVTDFDVWHEAEDDVTVDMVIENLRANAAAAAVIVAAVAERGLPAGTCACHTALDSAVITRPDAITAEQRERLGVIGRRVLN